MVDMNKIFPNGNADIMELMMTLCDPSIPIAERKIVWNNWFSRYYQLDFLLEFFSEHLFNGNMDYIHILSNPEIGDKQNFYELAINLDLGAIDPKAYYLFWILTYGHYTNPQIVKDAYDYDAETINEIFPNIEEIVFTKG